MPSFGRRSSAALDTVHPRLAEVLREAIRHVDFSVLEGHRNKVRQTALFEAGLSKKEWPDGKHNQEPSEAIDFAPWHASEPHIDWEDSEAFIFVAGIIMGVAATMGVELRSGADWDRDGEMNDERWRDFGHIEYIRG